jgi:hypothetical protein
VSAPKALALQAIQESDLRFVASVVSQYLAFLMESGLSDFLATQLASNLQRQLISEIGGITHATGVD